MEDTLGMECEKQTGGPTEQQDGKTIHTWRYVAMLFTRNLKKYNEWMILCL